MVYRKLRPKLRPRPKRIASLLLSWFERGHRSMPWRKTRDPYAIWVSEIMLQQTRVDTVIPYYERWMARFPTVEALATAPLEEVLELWSGLGYYSRARALHQAAGEIVTQRGGVLPHRAAELETLSGIGPYTAGAIASIAFGEAVPAIDGNGERVLSRLFLLGDRKHAWNVAMDMVPPENPSAFNQALMELGATVCKRTPECGRCPVEKECLAKARGVIADYPAAKVRKQVPTVALASVVISRRGDAASEFLLVKRPERGLWAGLWEFPTTTCDAGETPDTALARYLGRAGIALVEPMPMPMFHFEHVLTHRNMRFSVFRGELAERTRKRALAKPAPEALYGLPARWLTLDESLGAAISAATRRIAQAVKNCDYALPGETLPTSSKAASSRVKASSRSASAMSMGGQMRKTLP